MISQVKAERGYEYAVLVKFYVRSDTTKIGKCA